MSWHQRRPARWEAEQCIARQLLEDCRCGVNADGVAFVEGVFHVRSCHGHLYESVTVRIEYPRTFPDRGQTPEVVLLSHREHWRAPPDAHINADWSLCLYVPGEAKIDFTRDDSLSGLFAVLQTFLFKEYLFQQDLAREEITGRKAVWPGEARSHGDAGVAEAVRDLGWVGRNRPCPCGSGKKFKICCLKKFQR